MLFKLSSTDNKATHCGVLEFTAEEGTCYIPFWMMQNLLIEEGAVITVTNVSLPKATLIKLQPQSVDFLEISNPRAVLEHALRNFSVVTKGDVIKIPYNDKNYHFALKEVKPQDAACIIETDCNVDFDAPVGYQEPMAVPPPPVVSLPKESAFGENRSSACPSPATMSTTSSASNGDEQKPAGIRIVNGTVVRPEENQQMQTESTTSSMLAERTGLTGVQKNAAIPEAAAQVDYWALAAGDGARLDGKQPATLKDKEGNEVDIRSVRAEAAARRAEAAAAAQAHLTASGGQTVGGQAVAPTAPVAPAGSISKRKTKVGSKYSRLKGANLAFQGSANNLK
jgi:ubiquitin fusion degradation protein 1